MAKGGILCVPHHCLGLLMLLLLSSILYTVNAQLIRTTNGTLTMEIPGATLALSATTCAGAASANSVGSPVYPADQAAAIANTVSVLQPQITNFVTLFNTTSTRLDALAGSITNEQTRATAAEDTLTQTQASDRTRAITAEASLAAAQAATQTSLQNSLSGVQGSVNSLQPQINNAYIVLNSTGARVDAAAASIAASQVRAMGVESSLALSAQAAVDALQIAQISLATSVLTEKTRAQGVETALSSSLAASQSTLSLTQASLTTTQSTLTATQFSLSSTQASLSTAQLALQQTQSTLAASLSTSTSLAQQLSAMANCSALGLFFANGVCIQPSGGSGSGSSSSSSSSVSTCPLNSQSGNPVPPSCLPGFSPMSSSMPACSGISSSFPTTVQCKAVDCPPFSAGINVPSGCACVPGLNGTVIATNTTPYFSSTCTHLACPANSSGLNVFSGCSCNAGYSGNVSVLPNAPFFINSCTPVPCPANSSNGTLVINTCGCPAGFSGSYVPSNVAPFWTSNCVPANCPSLSSGSNVISGCTCLYGGTVNRSTVFPYFVSNCSPAPPVYCTPATCPATLSLSILNSQPYPAAPVLSTTLSFTASGTLVLGTNTNGYYVAATAIGGGGAGGSIYYSSMTTFGGRGQAGQVVSSSVAYYFTAGSSIPYTVGTAVSNPAGTGGNSILAGNPTSIPALGSLTAPGAVGGSAGDVTSSFTGGGSFSWRPTYTTYSGGGGCGQDGVSPFFRAGTGGTLNGGFGVDGGNGVTRSGGDGGVGCGGGGTSYQANVASTPGRGGSGRVEFYVFAV